MKKVSKIKLINIALVTMLLMLANNSATASWYYVTSSWVSNGTGYFNLQANDCNYYTTVQCMDPNKALPPNGHSYYDSGNYFYPQNNYYQTAYGTPINCGPTCSVPEANYTITASECGQNNGNVYVNAYGGGSNTHYYAFAGGNYDGPYDAYNFTNIAPGSWTFYVSSDPNNASCQKSFTVNVPEEDCGPTCSPPQITYNVTNADCGQNNGNVYIDGSGGGSNTHYYAFAGGNYDGPYDAYNFTNLAPGSFTFYISSNPNEPSCATTLTVNVSGGNPPNVSAGPNKNICQGESVQLCASGAITYLWNNGSNNKCITVSPNSTTTYTVTGRADGCSDVDNVTVTVQNAPNVSAGPDQRICEGESVQICASGASAYSWSNGSNTQCITVSPTNTSTYTVIGISNAECTDSDVIEIAVEECCGLTINVEDTTICRGENITIIPNVEDAIICDVSQGPSYIWSSGEITQTITVSPDVTTEYSVTITDCDNVCTDTDVFVINVEECCPLTADAGLDQIICEGESTTITATAENFAVCGSAGPSYLWSNGVNSPTQVVSPTSTTTYTVTITDCDNICTAIDEVTINVETGCCAPSAPDISIRSIESDCDTYPGETSINSTGGNNTEEYITSYLLVDSIGNIIDANTEPIFDILNAGSYTAYSLNFAIGGIDGQTIFIGENIANVTGSCFELSEGVPLEVCITFSNRSPIAINDDNITFREDPIFGNVLNNDTDPDGDDLTINTTAILPPSNGSVQIYPSGTYFYIPDEGFTGTDGFAYEICDSGSPQLCAIGRVRINVMPGMMNALVLNNDDVMGDSNAGPNNLISGTTQLVYKSANQAWTGNLMVNDIATNSVDLIMNTTPVTHPTNGTLILYADGSYEYTPNADYIGDDEFEYEVCTDEITPICGTAKMYITIVEDMNGAPFAGDDFFVVNENDDNYFGNIASNDYDTDGGTCAFTLINTADNTTENTMTTEKGATVTLNADGTFTYTPEAGYIGADAFCYTITDDTGKTHKATANIFVRRTHAKVNLNVFLAGALADATSMNTGINDRGLLPGQTPTSNLATPTPAGQPYNVAPWNYNGTEGLGWTDTDYETIEAAEGATVVDWVLVTFRTGIEENTAVGQAAGLLLNDGRVIFPENNALSLDGLLAANLYMVIDHRNHMGVMSPVAVNMTARAEMALDLRNADSYSTLTGIGQSKIMENVWAMPAGDASKITDADGYDINGNDKSAWDADNGKFDNYFPGDFNLDGDVNGGDKALWSENNGIFSNVPK